MLSKIVVDNGKIKVTLKCLVFHSVFNSKTEYDFFAQVCDGESTRNVYPEKLSREQNKMSVDEYVINGRCEFFQYIRPNHMLGLIGESQ